MLFFFNDTATTEIYTLSLHDALPISSKPPSPPVCRSPSSSTCPATWWTSAWKLRPAANPSCCRRDRKSTRLNSSHSQISYAVFCLKKKKDHQQTHSLECRRSFGRAFT